MSLAFLWRRVVLSFCHDVTDRFTLFIQKNKNKSSVPVFYLPELTYFEVLSSRILLGFIYIGSNYLGIEVLFAYFNVVCFILGVGGVSLYTSIWCVLWLSHILYIHQCGAFYDWFIFFLYLNVVCFLWFLNVIG